MFANLRISIFIYYFVTVIVFINLSYYFLVILNIDKWYIFAIVVVCFIILSAIFISKLAIDPLAQYVQSLQNLSKETLHELNLPISTIMSNAQMLSKNLHSEKDLKRLERINISCEMLKERYNELDYMIKMQSRENVKEIFFVDDLVRQRVEFLNKIYPKINFSLNVEPLSIFSDKNGLKKVIDNLIDNGVKYSPDSKQIDIQIQNNILTIKDYGIGMDEFELLKIFDDYYQSNMDIKGFGIGLSMVKRFCDKNRIELNIKSSLNIGTTVELKFKNI